MIFGLRQAFGDDANLLMDIDIKAFDQHWDSQQWQDANDIGETHVATFYGTPIAFIVFGSLGDETDGVVIIRKIAVKTAYRRRGVSKLLVAQARKYAIGIKARDLQIIIPESMCLPSQPHRDASEWAKRLGFKATMTIPDLFTNCGYSEDGYLFNQDVK